MDANTQQQDALGMGPGARGNGKGRRSKSGDPEVIKVLPIKEGSAEVMKLMREAIAAKTVSDEAFVALAERSGTKVAILKRLFKASLNGNFTDVRNDVDQAAILFEQVGEIQGGKAD